MKRRKFITYLSAARRHGRSLRERSNLRCRWSDFCADGAHAGPAALQWHAESSLAHPGGNITGLRSSTSIAASRVFSSRISSLVHSRRFVFFAISTPGFGIGFLTQRGSCRCQYLTPQLRRLMRSFSQSMTYETAKSLCSWQARDRKECVRRGSFRFNPCSRH